MVRLGIIGCGKITERACLPYLSKHPGVKIIYLCDINKKAALYQKNKFSLFDTEIQTDWRKVVASDQINAVYVATPNYLHSQMVISAAQNKKHILVEKPMALSLADAQNMINAAEKNRVFLMVEQSQRFDPLHIKVKKVLESGILGRVNYIRGRIGHAGPEFWSKKSNWFYDKKKSGGGVVIDIGVHILDLIRWFMDKKIVAVCADIASLEKKFKLDDNCNAMLRFEDGSMGGFECSWTTRQYEVKTYIYGQKGKLVTSVGKKQPLTVYLADIRKNKDPNCLLKEIIPQIPQGSAWANAMHYFVDCIKNNRRPFVDGNEGLETLKVILACYKSSQLNKRVDLV